MKLNYETDLDWDNAVITPLGRLYKALLRLGYSQEKVSEIVHAVTESGVYQEPDDNFINKIPA